MLFSICVDLFVCHMLNNIIFFCRFYCASVIFLLLLLLQMLFCLNHTLFFCSFLFILIWIWFVNCFFEVIVFVSNSSSFDKILMWERKNHDLLRFLKQSDVNSLRIITVRLRFVCNESWHKTLTMFIHNMLFSVFYSSFFFCLPLPSPSR